MKTEDEGMEVPETSSYGYGLCIHLNDDQCEALGIKEPLPAGAIVRLSAKAFVRSATQSVEGDGDDKGADVRLELQITDLELKRAGGFYDNSDMS